MRYFFTLNNIKTILVVIGIIFAIWFYKDWEHQRSENIRQTENTSQLRKSDSLRFASQNLTSQEIQDYLQYSNPDLAKKLKTDDINYNRIESIVSQTLKYRDTTKNKVDVSQILEAIKNKVPAKTPFIDTTKCQTNKGYVEYKNDSLKVVFTEKTFNNKTDAVAYWERRQWSLLGIKTRFLGKKQFTAKSYSDCGEIQTMKIEKKK
jgi:hypothetical protein